MERIIFSKSGPLDNFIEWLERFKGDISKESLIIEVDLATNNFIAKTYSEDKSLVRYSQISFDDANFSITEQSEKSGQRILIGIFMILSKFIDTIKTFSTSDNFTMTIDYDMTSVAGTDKWCSKSVTFKSKSLKMKIPGSSIQAVEMNPLSDDLFFNKVWVAPEPVSITISSDMLKNLVAISEIFLNKDQSKNMMEFYTKNNLMYVKDPLAESYDYELGQLNEGSSTDDVDISIYRGKFLLGVKNAFDETTFTISSKTPNRLLIELKGGNTKTIIARVNR